MKKELRKENIYMRKPVKRTIQETKNNFVDYLFETYEPKRNNAGEYYFNGLDYLTNEMSYMASDTEKEFIEEFGLAPIAFLELLRIQMAKTSGFGICINNKDLKKAMSNMAIDYEINYVDMQEYYSKLVEYQLIIIISDSTGNQYATTLQQIFNWEYKMWTRWSNNQYQKNKRNSGKSNGEDNEKAESNIQKACEDKEVLAPKIVNADNLPIVGIEQNYLGEDNWEMFEETRYDLFDEEDRDYIRETQEEIDRQQAEANGKGYLPPSDKEFSAIVGEFEDNIDGYEELSAEEFFG